MEGRELDEGQQVRITSRQKELTLLQRTVMYVSTVNMANAGLGFSCPSRLLASPGQPGFGGG